MDISFLSKCPNCGFSFMVRKLDDVTTTRKAVVNVMSSKFQDMDPAFQGVGSGRWLPSSSEVINNNDMKDPIKTGLTALVTKRVQTFACGRCGYKWAIEEENFRDENGHRIKGVVTEQVGSD
jgi:ribosomal protein S27AE